jgi:uncharacterized protein (TIGR03086 family)
VRAGGRGGGAPERGSVGGGRHDVAMSEIADRYRRLSQALADKIRAVPDQLWARSSPCPGWTARDVVRHLVQTQGMFAGFVGLSLDPGPDVDDEPLAAWTAASAQMQRYLDDPETAEREFQGLQGTSTLQDAVDRFLSFDLNVHGWDLSRAAGLDEHIDPAEFPRLWESVDAFGDMIRSEGAFGPAVDLPPGASEQDRLLAHLGRDPRPDAPAGSRPEARPDPEEQTR